MSDQAALHQHFQYASPRHQADTAVTGMWLFLATEVLFFGGLVLAWMVCRHWQQAGFDAGGRESVLAIGTINLALLLTSSLVYTSGLIFIEMDQPRRLLQCCVLTACLGAAFLVLKVWEWLIDIHDHLFPSMSDFKITGADEGGARLFWSFYFVATSLHALHMVVGIVVVCWIAAQTRAGRFSARWHTPVEVVGLYWSFVDIVWIVLFPLIYLVGRAT
jgi:cytochrome c oxidase subunit III